MGVGKQLKHAYNAFLNRSEADRAMPNAGMLTEYGSGYSSNPMRARYGFAGERSIISSIYVRLAMDCASVDIRHVKVDEQDRYIQDVKSGMHNCLNVEANIDQSGRAFLEDLYLSPFG